MASQDGVNSNRVSRPMSYSEALRKPLKIQNPSSLSAAIPKNGKTANECSNSSLGEVIIHRNSKTPSDASSESKNPSSSCAAIPKNGKTANECSNSSLGKVTNRNSETSSDVSSEIQKIYNQLSNPGLTKHTEHGKKQKEIPDPTLRMIFEISRAYESRNHSSHRSSSNFTNQLSLLIPDQKSSNCPNQSRIPIPDRRIVDDNNRVNQLSNKERQPDINQLAKALLLEGKTAAISQRSDSMSNKKSEIGANDYSLPLRHPGRADVFNSLLGEIIKYNENIGSKTSLSVESGDVRKQPSFLMPNRSSGFSTNKLAYVLSDQTSEHDTNQLIGSLPQTECNHGPNELNDSLPHLRNTRNINQPTNLVHDRKSKHSANRLSNSLPHPEIEHCTNPQWDPTQRTEETANISSKILLSAESGYGQNWHSFLIPDSSSGLGTSEPTDMLADQRSKHNTKRSAAFNKLSDSEGVNLNPSLDPYQSKGNPMKQNSSLRPHPGSENDTSENSKSFAERKNEEFVNQPSKLPFDDRRRNVTKEPLYSAPSIRNGNDAYIHSNLLTNSGMTDDRNLLSYSLSNRRHGDVKNRNSNKLPDERIGDKTDQLSNPFNGEGSISFTNKQSNNSLPNLATKDGLNPLSDKGRKDGMNEILNLLPLIPSHKSGKILNEEPVQQFGQVFERTEDFNPWSYFPSEVSETAKVAKQVSTSPFAFLSHPIETAFPLLDHTFESLATSTQEGNDLVAQPFNTRISSTSNIQTEVKSHFAINKNEESGVSSIDPSRLDIQKNPGLDSPSVNPYPLVNEKKVGYDFSRYYPFQCSVRKTQDSEIQSGYSTILGNKTKGRSKFKRNIPSRFLIKESEISDDLISKPPPVFMKENEELDDLSNKSSLCFANDPKKSEASSSKTPHLLKYNNEDSSSNKPLSLIVNMKEGLDSSSSIPPPLIDSGIEESDALSDYLTTEVVCRKKQKSKEQYKTPRRNHISSSVELNDVSHKTPPITMSKNERPEDALFDDWLPYNNKIEEPEFATFFQSQPIFKNEESSNAQCNKPPCLMISEKEGSGAVFDYQYQPPPVTKELLPSSWQRPDPCDEASRLVASENRGANIQLGKLYSLLRNRDKATDVESGEQLGLLNSKEEGSNQQDRTQNSESKGHLNIFVAGPRQCGKVLLIKTFVGEHIEVSSSDCSCVANKTDERTNVDIKIWYVRNLQGSMHLIEEQCSYVKSVIVLVYSIVIHQTLPDIREYIKEIRGRMGYRVPIVLVGNKVDVRTTTTIDEFDKANVRLNFFEDGIQTQSRYYLPAFFECSGKTGEGVFRSFLYAADLALYQWEKK